MAGKARSKIKIDDEAWRDGAGGRALLHKFEDLNPNPQYSPKRPSMASHVPVNPMLQRME